MTILKRIAYISGFFLLLLIVQSCGEEIQPGIVEETSQTVRDVRIGTARMSDLPLIYEAVGTVKAGIRSNLASKLMGSVKVINVREGDRVGKGDPLAMIDQRQVKAELDRAEAGVSEALKALAAALSARDAALADMELSRATYERYLNLKRQDSVSDQEFEEVESRYRQAKAALQSAEAVVEAAEARVVQFRAAADAARVASQDAVILAPHDGVITARLVDPGDLARPGMPLLILETTRGFCVDVVLPESYVGHIREGDKVSVTVPALNTDPMEGDVCTLVPSADPRSRSFIVKINIPADQEVRSGMFARVRIPIGEQRSLVVSGEAVIRRGQLTGLYILDQDNRAHFRLVRLGRSFEDGTEVLSGLKEGDRYILKPPPGPLEGAKVEAAP